MPVPRCFTMLAAATLLLLSLTSLANGRVAVSGGSNAIKFGGGGGSNASLLYDVAKKEFVFDAPVRAPNLDEMLLSLDASMAHLANIDKRLQLLEAQVFTSAPTHAPTTATTSSPTHVPTTAPSNPTETPTETPTPVPTSAPYSFAGKAQLQLAVDAWCTNSTAAEATYGSITTWDTSLVTDMSRLFLFKQTCNPNISGWNTAQVTTMNSMFTRASSFNQPLTNFNTSRVTDMNGMFDSASSFNQPLTSFDTSRVTSMAYMFAQADAFAQNISSWDVSRVTSASDCFQFCSFCTPPNFTYC